MKDKQKSLEDLDFLTELTLSEQEKINGGISQSLTSDQKDPLPQGGSTKLIPTPDDTTPPDGSIITKVPQYQSTLTF